MSKLEQRFKQLGEAALEQRAELEVDKAALADAEVLYAMLNDQTVLALLFLRANKHGTPVITIPFFCEVREDAPAMIWGENIYLRIFMGEKGELVSEINAGIYPEESDFEDGEVPVFRDNRQLKSWISNHFRGKYSFCEVISDVGSGWKAKMVRGLAAEHLARSHATRLEKIAEVLAGIIEPKENGRNN